MVNSPRLTPQRTRVENGQDSSLPLSTQHVRRSPRFSGSVTSEPQPEEVATLGETEKDDEAKIQSRPETPENDSANDEPSSVLASRIMRSHTNPSPPPDLPDTRQEEPLMTLVDDNVLDTPSRTGQEMLPDTPTPCATLALPNNAPLFLSIGEGSVTGPLVLSDAKDDKLGVFPADNLSSHPARRHASPAPPSSMGVAVSTLPTLDASCEPNPTEPLTLPRELQTAEGSAGSTTDEEIDVADALIPTEPIYLTDPTASTSELPPVQVVGPQTPVRTSSRPRKSVAVSSPPSPSKRKGKRKSLAGVETAQESTPKPHHLGGRREVSPLRTKMKEMARSSRRPVDSLSPGTVGLLGQIASNTPSPLPDVVQSDTSYFRFPTTFPALTDLQPPRSPSRSPSPNRTSSMSSHTLRLHDIPNQSPARRVPIAEVRDRGHNSPTKQANGQVMTLHVQPTDSPARRVAPNVPNTPRSAARPPTLMFGKPLSSPIRSRSVEPPVVVRTKPVVRSGSAEPVARQLPFPLKPASSRIPPSIPEEKEINDETVSLPPSTIPQSSKSVLRQHTPSKIPRLKPYARPRVPTTSNPNQSKAPNRKLDFTSTSTWTSTPSNPAAAAEVALQAKLAAPSTPQASGLKRKHDDIELPPTTSSTLRTINASSPTKSSLSVDIPRIQRTGIPNTHAAIVEPAHNHAASSHDFEVDTGEVEPSSTTRRTARPRRLPQGSHSLTKPSTQPATLSEPRQRKPPAVRTGPNLFRGLTPLAINSMTRTNTAKNEQYQTAQLETEVVRREGSRPESPVMKVKTRSQKEQDDKSKNRRLRAERRAQRLDTGSGDGEPLLSNGAEEESADIDAPGSPVRHRRGPGDEEDYVTPDRPPPQKRVRLDEDDGGVRVVKMVKWDKGLSKTIFVDEIEIGNWKRPKEIPSIKSCLAASAKSLRLDPLGNLAGPSPLPDLAKENVTVKKIVYDSDVGVLQPVEPAKNTRSRSKKSS